MNINRNVQKRILPLCKTEPMESPDLTHTLTRHKLGMIILIMITRTLQ